MREWKRSASKNQKYIEARRERQRKAEERRSALAAREAALAAALERPRLGTRQIVDRALAGERQPRRKLRELLSAIAEKAPRLVSEERLPLFERMADAHWFRSPRTWKPVGKGYDSLFRSLAVHLFARYPMPPFLWTVWFGNDNRAVLIDVALHVAAGGSLFDAVTTGLMPVPLTRKMCHEVLARGGEADFFEVIRREQVRAAGGNGRLLRAWLGTEAGAYLHRREEETFWQTVLEWFGANPMLPESEVGPLVDYIATRRRRDPGFSIRGRSVLALLRGMRDWHGELTLAGNIRRCVFKPSGFEGMDLDRSRKGPGGSRLTELWHIREILDSKTLAEEGRAMSHCVFSYANTIERGASSIWTLTLEDGTGHWRRLTIEVHNSTHRVVQARGRFNKMPNSLDLIPLSAWAGRNCLKLSVGQG